MAKGDAPAVIIHERHQSAPKEHYADKAIQQAAEEIDSGNWHPAEPSGSIENLPNVALRTGTPEMLEKPVTRADYAHTENSLVLAEHPRVQEAMARLAQERDDTPSTQEYFEKTQMLHELAEMKSRGNRWDGQERWQGAENIAARRGQVLTPLQFYHQLMKTVNPKAQYAHHTFTTSTGYVRVIGVGPIFLGREAVLQHPGQSADTQSGRVPLVVLASENRQILLPGQKVKKDEAMLVATLQWPAGTEWMIMNFDEFNVPTTAKFLGWRTALLSMVRSGVITEKQADKAFPLNPGPVSSWYRQQMKEWRHAHRGRPA
jgi:hypothetical protein